MAQVERPRFPDSVVNRCLVGRSRSGWAFHCLLCGEGKIYGRTQSFKWMAVEGAKEHRCGEGESPDATQ